jgi:hypothetical protein
MTDKGMVVAAEASSAPISASHVWYYQPDANNTFILKADGVEGHDGDMVVFLAGVKGELDLAGVLSYTEGTGDAAITWGVAPETA